ncbi:hypothetical protein [Nodularia sp. NIES-3585]|uniref:hypothetical protein n=1 Tax=Nodularia sp. NIES-3585 TaxID=1973477 RepID=UPI000B5C8E6D|nr:hypothetical protein [Nodularia sp. NIES-3585]GAX34591.1 hypothetical protein NIES3585_05920 [Nodularia sp. NIES-3585]
MPVVHLPDNLAKSFQSPVNRAKKIGYTSRALFAIWNVNVVCRRRNPIFAGFGWVEPSETQPTIFLTEPYWIIGDLMDILLVVNWH